MEYFIQHMNYYYHCHLYRTALNFMKGNFFSCSPYFFCIFFHLLEYINGVYYSGVVAVAVADYTTLTHTVASTDIFHHGYDTAVHLLFPYLLFFCRI